METAGSTDEAAGRRSSKKASKRSSKNSKVFKSFKETGQGIRISTTRKTPIKQSNRFSNRRRSSAFSFFSDAVEANELIPNVHFKMGDKLHGDDPFGRFRDICGWFVNSIPVQSFMIAMIISNAVLLGVMTFDFVTLDPDLQSQLDIVDLSLLCLFTFEFALQFIYLGFTFIKNSWITFDFVVIVLSWAFMGSSLTALRSLRIIRIFALVSKWKEMQGLFIALSLTLPKLSSLGAVLLLFFYVYCVLTVNLYSGFYDEGYLNADYFGDIEQAFVTLFQIMTFDSWHGVVRQVMDPSPLAWLTFYSFVSVTSFVVLNMMVAVVCETLIDLKTEEKAKRDAGIEPGQPLHSSTAIEDLIRLQNDLTRAQIKMEKTLKEIMAHLPPESAT